MPDYLARHLALGLVNRELLEVKLDKDGNPMTKTNVDGRTVFIPKYEGGETMTSPKFPEQVPLFMKFFNQAYSPDASEEVGMSEDDIDTQIDVSNKNRQERGNEVPKTGMENKEPQVVLPPDSDEGEDDESSFKGKPKEKLILTAADYYGEGKREKKLSPFIFEALGDKAVGSEKTLTKVNQLSFLDFKAPKVQDTKSNVPEFHIDYLSYSQIETFQTCPLHYKLRYIYKVPTPPSASASFGTTIHAALKIFYEKVSSGEKPSEKLLLGLLDDNWVREGYTSKKHESEFALKGKDYLIGFLKYGFNSKILPIALEQPFTVPIGKDLKIGGRVDRVDDLGNGEIEIVDYKTGATIPTQKDVDKNLQLSFYALAATKIPTVPFGKNPDKIKLSLYYLDEQEKISTVRTAEQLEEAVTEILKVREEMEKSDFKCSNHLFCQRGCEFSLFCKSDG